MLKELLCESGSTRETTSKTVKANHRRDREATLSVRKLAILGSGGAAREVAEIANALGFSINVFIDRHSKAKEIYGVPVVSNLDFNPNKGYHFAIGVGDNFLRQKLLLECGLDNRLDLFPALVHPAAQVSRNCNIAPGSLIHPFAYVGPGAEVGKFSYINKHSSVGHDSLISDFASTGPMSALGGQAVIGARTAISIGATVKNKVQIGDDVVVGAASYVHSSLPSRVIALGTPAKVIRLREPGDAYL